MKKLLKKDKKNRKLVKTFEHKKFILKNLMNNSNFSINLRWISNEKLFYLPTSHSSSRVNNRCVVTGRNTRINKLFSFSRIVVRKLLGSSLVNGFKKSSW